MIADCLNQYACLAANINFNVDGLLKSFWQLTIDGLSWGAIYALVAVGYTLVFGVLRLINFAHGDLSVLGAYIGLVVLTGGLSGAGTQTALVALAFVAAAVVVGAAGAALEFVAYRPLRKADRLAAVVSALGASLLIENGIMLIWGPQLRVFPQGLLPSGSWEAFGTRISLLQILIIAGSALLMAALYLFVHHTRFGTAMRAAAIDQDAARLMGINVNRVITSVFVIGPALGAIGGLFIGLYYRQVYFTMGWTYGLNAFIAAILGGIGNIPGAMLGGVLIGIIGELTKLTPYSGLQDVLVFTVLIAVLLVKPTGLLGKAGIEKV